MPPSNFSCQLNVRMHSGSKSKCLRSACSPISTPGTIRVAMSAMTAISELRAGRTSMEVSVDRESKSCRLLVKLTLSIPRLRIYRCFQPGPSTLAGGDFGYAATIAPGCCDHAAPDRRNPGRIVGRPEVVPRLCAAQKFPQRGRPARRHQHYADATD